MKYTFVPNGKRFLSMALGVVCCVVSLQVLAATNLNLSFNAAGSNRNTMSMLIGLADDAGEPSWLHINRTTGECTAEANETGKMRSWEYRSADGSLHIKITQAASQAKKESYADVGMWTPNGWEEPMFVSSMETSYGFTPMRSFEEGETIYLNFAYANYGEATIPANAMTYEFYLSKNGGTETHIANGSYDAVLPKLYGSAVEDRVVDSLQDLTAGTYSLRIVLNEAEEFEEDEYDNNEYEIEFQVKGSGAEANADVGMWNPNGWPSPMFLAADRSSLTAATEFKVGDTIYLNFAYANYGAATIPADDMQYNFYLSKDGGNESRIAHGGYDEDLPQYYGSSPTDKVVDSLQNLTVGTYILRIALNEDENGDPVFDEDGNYDNEYCVEFTVGASTVALPDVGMWGRWSGGVPLFVASSKGATAGVTTFAAGEPIYLNYAYANYGAGTVYEGDMSYAFSLKKPGSDEFEQFATGSYSADLPQNTGSFGTDLNWTPLQGLSAGHYVLKFELNTEKKFKEGNVYANEYSIEFDVTGESSTEKADVGMWARWNDVSMFLSRSEDSTEAATTFDEEDDIYLSFAYANYGKATISAGQMQYAFYLSKDGGTPEKVASGKYTKELPENYGSFVSGKQFYDDDAGDKLNQGVGSYVLTIKLNPDKLFEEGDAHANEYSIEYTVTKSGVEPGEDEPTTELSFGFGKQCHFYGWNGEDDNVAYLVGVSGAAYASFKDGVLTNEKIVDTEKSSALTNAVDAGWCSVYAGVNMLTWTGWSTSHFATEDDFADYLRNNPSLVSDEMGYDAVGLWKWYFSEKRPGILYTNYLEAIECQTTDFAENIQSALLYSDRIMYVDIVYPEKSMSHGATCCGYVLDGDEGLLGLFMIDSDDDKATGGAAAANQIRFCNVEWSDDDNCYLIDNPVYGNGLIAWCATLRGEYDDKVVSKADLMPYTVKAGKNAPIVLTTSKGDDTSVNMTTFRSGDTIYANFGIKNGGNADIDQAVPWAIYVDGTEYASGKMSEYLGANEANVVADVFLGCFNVGTHTVELRIAGSEEIAESNYVNNNATLSFTVVGEGTSGDAVHTEGLSSDTNVTAEAYARKLEQGMFTGAAAKNYVAWLVDGDGGFVGYATVKTSKTRKKGGVTASATIETLGSSKKYTLKGTLQIGGTNASSYAVGQLTAKKCAYTLVMTNSDDCVSGALVSSTGETISMRGNAIAKKGNYAAYAKTWNVAMLPTTNGTDNAYLGGWCGLTVVGKKNGSAKVTGMLPDGTKVSVSAKMVLTDQGVYIPVLARLYKKKAGGFGLLLNAAANGTMSTPEEIRPSKWIAVADKNHSEFSVNWSDVTNATISTSMPNVNAFGADLDRLYFTQVANGTIDVTGIPDITSTNVGGVVKFDTNKKKWKLNSKLYTCSPKLSYAIKTGTFKGSFKVPLVGSRKTATATVNGVMIGDVGYGSAVIKRGGSLAVRVQSSDVETPEDTTKVKKSKKVSTTDDDDDDDDDEWDDEDDDE